MSSYYSHACPLIGLQPTQESPDWPTANSREWTLPLPEPRGPSCLGDGIHDHPGEAAEGRVLGTRGATAVGRRGGGLR